MFPIPTPQPLYGYGSYQHSSYHSASKTLGPYQSDAYPTSGYPPPSPVPYDSGELEFGTNTILPWWTFPRSSEFPGASRQELPNPDLDPKGQANLWAWTWDRTAKSLVLSPIVIFTILGNFLVLYAFFSRKKDLRSPTHFFIANLSLADFLVGILAMPFLAVFHTTDRWYFGPNFCYAWVIIHFWLCSASILSTLAVCIERYVGVKYPLRHQEIMSRQRVLAMILGVWFLSGFLSLVSVLAFPEPLPAGGMTRFQCILNNQLGHVLIATIGILYIPAVLMILLYWRIYVIASTHLRAIKGRAGGQQGHLPKSANPAQIRAPSKTRTWSKLNLFRTTPTPYTIQLHETPSTTSGDVEKTGNSGQNYSTAESEFSFSTSESIPPGPKQPQSPTPTPISPVPRDPSRKQVNLAKRLSLLIGILLLSYVPFFTAFLLRGIAPNSVRDTTFTLLGWIRYSNSALNPIIYAYAVPTYRKAFQGIFTRRKS